MTTFIGLASSATMFPTTGNILCSPLTPELIEERPGAGLALLS